MTYEQFSKKTKKKTPQNCVHRVNFQNQTHVLYP